MKHFETVLDLIRELCEKEEISLEAELQNDLGMDSLSLVMLLVELEERCKISLDEADLDPFDLKTVAGVLALVEKYKEKDHE